MSELSSGLLPLPFKVRIQSISRVQTENCTIDKQSPYVKLLLLHYSDWVCTAVISNDVMKDLRG